MAVTFSKDVSNTWARNRLGHSWMNFINTLLISCKISLGCAQSLRDPVQATNLCCRTTSCNTFLNMASNMIERWSYRNFGVKCFTCHITNSLRTSVKSSSHRRCRVSSSSHTRNDDVQTRRCKPDCHYDEGPVCE